MSEVNSACITFHELKYLCSGNPITLTLSVEFESIVYIVCLKVHL